MSDSDVKRIAGDVVLAFGLLTRLPLPPAATDPGRGAAAAWAWPLAGAVTGALTALTGMLAMALGLAAGPAAALALAATVLVTGGLHEDGLADTADGFWGGATQKRRLEIMRDSRIGSYGALALGLSLILRWSAIWALAASGAWGALIASAALSRAGMAALMATLPPARSDGLSRTTGRPPRGSVLVALAIALVLAVLSEGGRSILAAAGAGLALIWVARLAQTRIGGQTGDVLGAGQQVAETAALLIFAARPA